MSHCSLVAALRYVHILHAHFCELGSVGAGSDARSGTLAHIFAKLAVLFAFGRSFIRWGGCMVHLLFECPAQFCRQMKQNWCLQPLSAIHGPACPFLPHVMCLHLSLCSKSIAHLGHARRFGTFGTPSIVTRWIALDSISTRCHGPLADSHHVLPHPPTLVLVLHSREQTQQYSGPWHTVQLNRIVF